jgi:hypothetical protein
VAGKRQKIAILYGFGEGPRVAVRFLKAIEDAGYEMTDIVAEADCIVTHSGGCYLLAESTSAARVIMTGPCYYFHRSRTYSFLHKLRQDFAYARRTKNVSFWTYKTAWNVIYTLFRPLHTARMVIYSKTKKDDMPHLPRTDVALICYLNDEWSKNADKGSRTNPNYDFSMIDQPHDDIWYNPDKYVGMIGDRAD